VTSDDGGPPQPCMRPRRIVTIRHEMQADHIVNDARQVEPGKRTDQGTLVPLFITSVA
jgi:hypothetical protein